MISNDAPDGETEWQSIRPFLMVGAIECAALILAGVLFLILPTS